MKIAFIQNKGHEYTCINPYEIFSNSFLFFQFFDDIKIEDPRVYELCNKSGQPSPFQILLECLKRLVPCLFCEYRLCYTCVTKKNSQITVNAVNQ